MAESKAPVLLTSKKTEVARTQQTALKTQQAAAKTTQTTVQTTQATAKTTEAVAKSVQASAKTTQADVQSAAVGSKRASVESAAPKMAPQVQPSEEEDDEEEDDDEDEALTSGAPTRTSSLAMPSNYVPPQLNVNAADMPISLAPGAEGAKTALATARVKSPLGAIVPKVGGKKKKRKKKKPKMMDARMFKSATAINQSVLPGEKETLQQQKGKGKRRGKEMVDPRARATRRRMICLGVVIAILVAAVCIAIVCALTLRKPSASNTNEPSTAAPAPTTQGSRS